ncbi:hypothetical protein BBK36DRAFT_1203349 [Trichoderma citrinoviride]|uniref:Uncharacterized protein n=1 Tax=Trichoderma citrinoviride TaxID=58853 RepID=A0A2T4B9M4_9HYPO|nr:hypothetical protein BBK36DRAFT_1203349 [Trichoderma citrinoviride]PTB65988.1 hypothetical protein BBK36DRAFT_1203349 [Trichoderma citrinoviride]
MISSPYTTATKPSKKGRKRKAKKTKKTYNSRCSLVVTHPTTNLPVRGLSMGERTGPRALLYLWSYVLGCRPIQLMRRCDIRVLEMSFFDFRLRSRQSAGEGQIIPCKTMQQGLEDGEQRAQLSGIGVCNKIKGASRNEHTGRMQWLVWTEILCVPRYSY